MTLFNSLGIPEPDPQEMGYIPEDDPFWGDPDYPMMLKLSSEDGSITHCVIITSNGPHFFMWNCREQNFEVFTIEPQGPPPPPLPGAPFPGVWAL